MMVVVVVSEVMCYYSDAWVHRAKGEGDGRHDDKQSRPTIGWSSMKQPWELRNPTTLVLQSNERVREHSLASLMLQIISR